MSSEVPTGQASAATTQAQQQAPAPTTQAQVQLIRGIVKCVNSGDSLVIRGQPKGGPPPEQQINLAYVMAPKVARKTPDGQFTNDESYGWQAREFLRKKLVGKEIAFKSEYKIMIGNQNRDFGMVLLLGEGGESIVELMVSEGLVEVVRKSQNKDIPEFVKLCELEELAKLAGKGKWSSTPSEKREVLQDVDEPAKLVNKTYNGVVDYVRDGSTMKVALELEPRKKYQMVMIMLSGIRCPQKDQPFGVEATFFTESRMLQRDVTVRIEQTSGGGNSSSFVGTITMAGKNIAEYLLKEGMAKCVDWSIGLTQDPAKLRAAEKEAKSKKLRIWKDYKEAAISVGTKSEFEAKVIEVINADALTVHQGGKHEPKKIFISSIRAPKLDNKGDEAVDKKQFRPLYDIPFMLEAREYLRKRLIGKKVLIKVDYVQPKTEQYPEKTCCTIIIDGMNIGEALVSRGLASVVRYRPDDESRSQCYDALLAAEMKAQKSGKGIFSNSKDSGVVRIVDLSGDQSKAKSYLPFLTRASNARKDAIAEFIYSASRVKIYIQKENCLLNLILAGVNAPKQNDALGPQAAAFVKSLIHQKDVQIAVDGMDKVGNFIGWIYFDTAGNKSLALELVKAGFASVRDTKFGELVAAEEVAKQKKIGIWENYVEDESNNTSSSKKEDDTVEEESGYDVKASGEEVSDLDKRKKLIITNVSQDMTSFHGQFLDEGPEFEELITEMREELTLNPPLPGAYTPKKGDLCVAKFTADQQWYRAKIVKQPSGNQVQVVYIDYGNSEVLPTRSIAALPSAGKYSGKKAAATEYALAFAKVPASDSELLEDARNAFIEDTSDKVFYMKGEYRDANTGLEAVTLIEEESKKDVVLNLVSEGLFLADIRGRRERRLQKNVNEYKNAQENAKKNRLNLWRYGDFTEDDAKEFGMSNRS